MKVSVEELHHFYPEGSIKKAFLGRPDIQLLSIQQQESRWQEHYLKVKQFFSTLAGMDCVVLQP